LSKRSSQLYLGFRWHRAHRNFSLRQFPNFAAAVVKRERFGKPDPKGIGKKTYNRSLQVIVAVLLLRIPSTDCYRAMSRR